MSTATALVPTFLQDAYSMRYSVAQYQKMIEGGILTHDDKVELLENYLVLKMPRNPPHDGTIMRLSKRLSRVLPEGWDLRNQSAVVLGDSQPEPDLAIVRASPDDYSTQHPGVRDVGLLIEVADSSLVRDQRDKARIYGRAGVPVYWVVNVPLRQIEVHTAPTGPCDAPGYAAVAHFGPGDAVPLVLDGTLVASIAVADLLP